MAPPLTHSCRRVVQRWKSVQAGMQNERLDRNALRKANLRELYPNGKILERGYHRVSSLHRIYYEIHGNPHGPAAVVLHGGPGAGCTANLGFKLFPFSIRTFF